ncbi:MAG: undecaprenyl-diphosphate phosphatase [Oscillospiraceae bacterium]|jgi:undecaprenyl-diphosphatase|nr:undecaprenyl-diphosphate phosphatase [Oscillospiraceae bacterium]
MERYFAAILGLIQGLAEFLPISSSGHLSAMQNLLGMEKADMLFEVLLHFATLIAVCVAYRHDIAEMISEVIGFIRDLRHPRPGGDEPKPARRLALMLVIASLPLALVLPFRDYIDRLNNNTYFIGAAFIFTGAILFLSDRMRNGRKTEKNMSAGDAVKIGLVQALATLPGLSRSGSTITAGMATGLNRSFAVKFSFLLSLPAVLAATLLELISAVRGGADTTRFPAYLLGMVIAGVTGFFAIRAVRLLARKGKFGQFCYYCFFIGILTIVLTIIL